MKIKIYNIMAMSMLLSLAACSNGEEWTPGPADDVAGVRAYFVNPSKTSYIFEVDAPASELIIDVKVERLITDNAISIPLNLTSDAEGFSLMGNAEFEAGQAETTVQVSCADIPVGKQATFTLAVPEDQFYTYGEGLPSVSYTAIKASWIECADKVTYLYLDYLDGSDVYPNTYGKLYRLEGTFQFRMTDFFGSGLDMEFICTTGSTTAFNPLTNCDYESAKGGSLEQYDYWYFYDEENETWPEWIPGDVEGYPAIQYVGVYGSFDYTDITMISDRSTLYGYLYLSTYITYSDGNAEYGDWYATFNLNEDPFK